MVCSLLEDRTKYPTLTLEQESELIKKIRTGTKDEVKAARTKLIGPFLNISKREARRTAIRFLPLSARQRRIIDLADDLLGEAVFSYFKAERTFDPNLGYKFITNGTRYIKQDIYRAAFNYLPLCKYRHHDGNGSFLDTIEDNRLTNQQSAYERDEMIFDALQKMSLKEEIVVRMRYGISGTIKAGDLEWISIKSPRKRKKHVDEIFICSGTSFSHKQVGSYLGCSPHAVELIEKEAKKKLGHYLTVKYDGYLFVE